MLLMTKSHHESIPNNNNNNSNGTVVSTPERLSNANNKQSNDNSSNSNSNSNSFLNVFEEDRKSNFLTTSRIIRLFGAGVKAPEK